MRAILAIFLYVTSLFLSFSSAQAAESALTLPQGDFAEMRKTGLGRVSNVISPLTVKLEDGRVIHLAGLDFPDLDLYESGDFSVTALKILEDFLKNKNVVLYQTPSTKQGRVNRMGHHIAHIVRVDDHIWAQGLLLSLGVARVRTTLYNPEMAAQMLALEKAARENKGGLWDVEAYSVISPDEAKGFIGGYQIVEGVVKSVSLRKNKLYMNFGNNWRDDFTVGVSKSNLRRFTRQKLEPQQWNGKKIRVRGWIESYNGPYMDIDHPARIELLFASEKEAEPSKARAVPSDSRSALPDLQ